MSVNLHGVVEPGTPLIWGDTGASGGDGTPTSGLVLTLNALANAAARMGVVRDLGAQFEMEYGVTLVLETGTAPTEQAACVLYLVSSPDGTNWAAGVSGADGAFHAGAEASYLSRADWSLTMPMTAAGNTIMRVNGVWAPIHRYVVPVVFNQSGQALRATTNHRVILTPRQQGVA